MRPSLRPVLLVAAVALAARAATMVGLELYSDEAYYWLWSRRPSLGYFDHPPLAAWLIRAGTALAPGAWGEWGVRLPFLLCGALAIVFAGLAARELSDDPRAPLYGALLAASAPLFHVNGALALPDAPLVAAYGAAVWLLAAARGARWAAAGLAVGLALLAKYSAALLAPALLVLVVWDPGLRDALRTRWPWLGAVVALAVFGPTLAWDAAHGFRSIGFQLHHGFRKGATLRSFAEYVGAQLGVLGPVALPVGVLACVRARTSAQKRVAAASLVALAVPIYSAMRSDGEANWTIHALPGLSAAAGAWLADRRDRARLAARAAVVGSVVVAALFAAGFTVATHSTRFVGTTTYYRFHGWREAAARVRAHADALCAAVEPPCDPARPFVVPSTYRLAPIAYYGGWTRLGGQVGRASQLSLWNDQPRPGEVVLLVADGNWDFDRAQEQLTSFELALPRRPATVTAGGKLLRDLWVGAFRPRR